MKLGSEGGIWGCLSSKMFLKPNNINISLINEQNKAKLLS